MLRFTRPFAALLALALLVPALAQGQEAITGENFDWETVRPYGEVEIAYEPYDVVESGAIVLSHTTPEDQHANFDIVGPDGYWEHFDFSDEPGEEYTLEDLLPGVYSIAATDDGLELAHAIVEVRAGEIMRVHVNMGIWEEGAYAAGTYDPYGYYGTDDEDGYPGFPQGAYLLSPYEPAGPFERAGTEEQFGVFAVEAELEGATYVVTGPNGYSESFDGSFVAEELWPGVYAIAATAEGFGTSVTALEVQPARQITVTPTLVELPTGQ